MERPNIERPVFRKFETWNIEIPKVELFDFLYFFKLQYFEKFLLFEIEQLIFFYFQNYKFLDIRKLNFFEFAKLQIFRIFQTRSF